MNITISVPDELLKRFIKEAIREEVINTNTIYSRNQIAQKLRVGNGKVKRLIEEGKISTTADGKVTQESLNDYLKGVVQY